MEAIKLVQNCLANYPNLEGAAALNLLIENPDTPIEAMNLAYAIQDKHRRVSLGRSQLCQTPIPMTDTKTLHAVNKRLNTLIAMKAEMLKQESFAPSLATPIAPHLKGAKDSCADNCTHDDRMSPSAPIVCSKDKAKCGLNDSCSSCSTSAIDAEIKALIHYRRECVRPGGAIRSFNTDNKRAYYAVLNAIKRVLKNAEKDGHHEAVAIIKTSLKQGEVFTFVGTDTVPS